MRGQVCGRCLKREATDGFKSCTECRDYYHRRWRDMPAEQKARCQSRNAINTRKRRARLKRAGLPREPQGTHKKREFMRYAKSVALSERRPMHVVLARLGAPARLVEKYQRWGK